MRIRRFLAFCRRFVAHDPRGVGAAFSLTLVLGALRGVGILMLVPLLAYLGVPDDPGGGGPVTEIAGFFFDRLGLPRNLVVILAVYVVLVAGRAALDRVRVVLQGELQLGFVRTLRADLHAALLHAEWRFLVASRRSDLIQTLTHDVQRAGKAAHQLLSVVTGTLVLLVFIGLALRISVWGTVLATAVTGLLAWLLRHRFSSAHRTGRDLTDRSNRLYAVVTGHLDGLAEIRSYGAEARSRERFARTLRELDEARLDFIRGHSGARLWMDVGGVVTLAVILGLAVEVLRLPVASLLLLVYIFSLVLPRATALHSQLQHMLNELPAFEAVDSLVRQATRRTERRTGHSTTRLRDEIAFREVSFSYEDDRSAVADLDLRIRARATTAVVGPSGSGKSTTALLLMGLLSPDTGRILVDGVEMGELDLREWRSRIGYVPQETFLLHDTIRANLHLARPDADDEEIHRALSLAAADDFVDALPRGLDTVVGDRGARLSGGERQRIALARALVVRPDLLLLDEATSSLDMESERRIFRALNRLHGRLTIVLITHRLGSLKNVDEIVTMEEGRVVGDRETLARAGSERMGHD